jgi:putative flavoprotein involved in K+ transport
MPERVEVVVIGGGQAGLAISYELTQQAREHVVLEQAAQVANVWRNYRWDSFTLVTPNWMLRLPGFPYQGNDPDGFLSREEVVSYLEQYAASFHAPLCFGVRVTAIDPQPGGEGYRMQTADGMIYVARHVVVATGSFQSPKLPACSSDMPAAITQLHSSHYCNPEALPPGAVLVVGSADSGCQIAEELYQSGRPVYLCVGGAGRRPRRYRGKEGAFWVDKLGRFDQTADELPSPQAKFAANPQLSGKNGGHTLNLHQFARDRVVLLGRLMDVRGSKIRLAPDLAENLAKADQSSEEFQRTVDAYIQTTGMDAPEPERDPVDEVRSDAGKQVPLEVDLTGAGITTVVWATGYRFDYSWVHLPVLDTDGFPVQRRGVTAYPGLYFLGMHFLYNRKSGIFFGVGDDAAHIALAITTRV